MTKNNKSTDNRMYANVLAVSSLTLLVSGVGLRGVPEITMNTLALLLSAAALYLAVGVKDSGGS